MSAVDILIADDHELVRLGLVRILHESHPEWRIVGEAANGQTAVELGISTRPQIAILDLLMPDLTGLEVARRLLESVPGIRIVILTMYAAKPIVRQLRRAGVVAYLAKNEAPRILIDIVERSLRGKPFYASACTPAQADQAAQDIPAQFLLTPRELEVLRLLARGKSNKELAAQLDMGVRTAESHHANLLVKLRVDSLAELVRRAVRDGVV
ncbi:MAG TPA: response regulator transcription factor [Bryobacteraceae bacterium]|jgi:DNA-binding NarL/FixJ family response regulator|nr:response regulator transcription factor [Bryobacteraceae bacterium]